MMSLSVKQQNRVIQYIIGTCKCMNTKFWIVASCSCISSEIFQLHIDSLKYIFNQFKNVSSLKTIAFHKLEEWCIELIEYTNKYYDMTIFNPTYFGHSCDKTKHDCFKGFFLLAELSFSMPYSNATIERFFKYMKIVKID